MARSSLPVTYRRPQLEHGLDTPIERALSMAYGDLNSYGFHALELLQCMVDRKRGGESGIAAVQCLEADTVWDAANQGLWSRHMANSTKALIEPKKLGRMEDNCKTPAVFLLEYRDGLRTATLILNGHLNGWAYAAQMNGKLQASEFYLSDDPYPHFSYLCLNIQQMFLIGRPQYSVQRTLLVSDELDALMTSHHRGYLRIAPPAWLVAYRPYQSIPIRPGGQ